MKSLSLIEKYILYLLTVQNNCALETLFVWKTGKNLTTILTFRSDSFCNLLLAAPLGHNLSCAQSFPPKPHFCPGSTIFCTECVRAGKSYEVIHIRQLKYNIAEELI